MTLLRNIRNNTIRPNGRFRRRAAGGASSPLDAYASATGATDLDGLGLWDAKCEEFGISNEAAVLSFMPSQNHDSGPVSRWYSRGIGDGVEATLFGGAVHGALGMELDGTGYLTCSNFLDFALSSGKGAIFAVYNRTGGGSFQRAFGTIDFNNGPDNGFSFTPNSTSYRLVTRPNKELLSYTTDTTVVASQMLYANTGSGFYVDGVLRDSGTNLLNEGVEGIVIGAAAGSPKDFLVGTIAVAAVVQADITEAQALELKSILREDIAGLTP